MSGTSRRLRDHHVYGGSDCLTPIELIEDVATTFGGPLPSAALVRSHCIAGSRSRSPRSLKHGELCITSSSEPSSEC
jgi:hypothetical protein